jgi:hypothetical protein
LLSQAVEKNFHLHSRYQFKRCHNIEQFYTDHHTSITLYRANNIAEETTFTLPKIPQLLGEENLEEWKAAIHNHFEWYDILKYLLDDILEPPKDNTQARKTWKQARLKGKITIHFTLNSKTVRDKLKNSG